MMTSRLPIAARRAGETFVTAVAIAAANVVAACVALLSLMWHLMLGSVSTGRPTVAPTLPRAVLITGGSSGIGRALALKYARPGAVIIVTGRNADRLNVVAEELRKKGAEVVAGVVDVASRDEMAKFVLEQDTRHRLDLVIANAGVSSGILGFKGLEENTEHLNKINVDGVYHTVLPLLERFKQRRSGQLVVVSSLSGFFDYPRGLAYSAGKSSLIVFWRGLRHIMSLYNVRVNTVCPGFVETGFTSHTRARGGSTPLIISSGRSADIIFEGLQNNDPVIAFPFPLYLAVLVLHSLPPQVTDLLINKIAPTQFEWNHLG